MKIFSRNYINSDPIQDFGQNIIMRKYLFIPDWLPFIAFMEHGWTGLVEAGKTDLDASSVYKIIFVFNKRRFDAYKNATHSYKKVFISGMPFVIYRRSKNLTKKNDAKGTVAFPSHGTDLVTVEYDIKNYCIKLNELSPEFHPITICLHYDNMYQREIYNTLGFKVVTAGTRYDPNFYCNFYEILMSHKYATSNVVGSHSFYSIDLDIPFFILGEEPEYINHFSKDPNVPEKYKISDFFFAKEAYRFFSTGPVTNISEEQKKYVEKQTGIKDASKRMSLIIYYWFYFFQWFCVTLIKKVINRIKNIIHTPHLY